MHLYVHVPFCARRCSYCDFSIAVRRSDSSAEFVAAIAAEWKGWSTSPLWDEVGPIETIYFGGGTPSRVSPGAIETILDLVRADRTLLPEAEITLEVNPEDVDPITAQRWTAIGINRFSLGVQSFTEPALRWMHRVHDAERPVGAVDALRAAGATNVSLDLIYALPRLVERSWEHDLERALQLQPEHLSLYALTVEPRTPLGRWVMRGETAPPADADAATEYLAAHARLEAAGWAVYEVSNASRPGFESRHNRAYWRRASYLGLGPAAHSAHGAERWWNIRDWPRYRRAASTGGDLVEGREALTEDQAALERLYLGLRTSEGIAASSLPESRLAEWIAAGWAGRVGSRARLTPEGWLRLDSLVGQVGTT